MRVWIVPLVIFCLVNAGSPGVGAEDATPLDGAEVFAGWAPVFVGTHNDTEGLLEERLPRQAQDFLDEKLPQCSAHNVEDLLDCLLAPVFCLAVGTGPMPVLREGSFLPGVALIHRPVSEEEIEARDPQNQMRVENVKTRVLVVLPLENCHLREDADAIAAWLSAN